MPMTAPRSFPFLACALLVLAGCGLSDAYSSMPAFFRRAPPPPPAAEAEPDTKALVGAGVATLFTAKPSAVAVSHARHNPAGPGYTVCVKAVVPGPMNSGPTPVTLVVSIQRGQLAERRRAEPQDGCEAESYEPV
jgi:hypothetical protein